MGWGGGTRCLKECRWKRRKSAKKNWLSEGGGDKNRKNSSGDSTGGDPFEGKRASEANKVEELPESSFRPKKKES